MHRPARRASALTACLLLLVLSTQFDAGLDGHDADPTAIADVTTSPTTAASLPLEPVQHEGGTVIEGVASAPLTFNPVLAEDTATVNLLDLIYEGLIEPDPRTAEPVGVLATTWEVSPDRLTWTLRLREDVRWHDGEPFTADDVAFTYQLLLNEATGSSLTSLLTGKVAGVTAVDPTTVRFTLTAPLSDFLVDAAVYGILPRHIWQDVAPAAVTTDPGSTGDDLTRVVGTGPFKPSEHVSGDHVTLARNEAYWGGAPHLEEYIYKTVPNTIAAIQQLRTGEIDWIEEVPGDQITALREDGFGIIEGVADQGTVLVYNHDPARSQLFQDVRVRQALIYALDRQVMVDGLRYGLGEVAFGPFPSASWALNTSRLELTYPHHPDRAHALLDEAGWTDTDGDSTRERDGERLAFTMYVVNEPVFRTYAEVLQQAWRQIGIDAQVQLEELAPLLERVLQRHEFEMLLISFQGWLVLPDPSPLLACGQSFNLGSYCNPAVDDLLVAARGEHDRAARSALLTELQNIILRDLPWFYIDYAMLPSVYAPRLHNVRDRQNVEQWWVDE